MRSIQSGEKEHAVVVGVVIRFTSKQATPAPCSTDGRG